MFNAFGDNRTVGATGPPGKNAFDLIRWTPHAARRMFRESELINIYFDTLTDGIILDKDQKPIGLKNRARGPSVDLIKNFPKISRIKNRKYMMELNNSLFKVSPIKTGVTSPSLIIFALSFKGVSYNIVPRFLFSNESITRAISIQDRPAEEGYDGFLKIYSSGTEKEISFDRTDWSTLLIQYRCVNQVVYCQYLFNEEIGSLEPGKEDKEDKHTLYIGGHPRKKGADCAVASFEVYYANDGTRFLSDEMSRCLLEDIAERADPDNEQ